MSDECNHDAIFNSFTSRRSAARQQAIHDAYIDVHADELLARMLDESADRAFDKVVIAAHLDNLMGAPGDEALRRAIRVQGPGSRDLRNVRLCRAEA